MLIKLPPGSTGQYAIQTVRDNASEIDDVHVEKQHHNVHGTDKACNEALHAAGVQHIQWHTTFDAKHMRTLALITLQSDHYVARSEWSAFLKQMETYSGPTRNMFREGGCDHFGISGQYGLDVVKDVSFAYGFILVTLVLDTLGYMLHMGRYFSSADVRATIAYTSWPSFQHLASPPSRALLWVGTRVCPPLSGGGAIVAPRKECGNVGMAYVLHAQAYHVLRTTAFGLAWITLFLLACIYYHAFAVPFWWWWISKQQLYSGLSGMVWYMPWTWHWTMQSAHLLHLSFVGALALFYVEAHRGMLALYILLYPFYLSVYPLIMLVALLYNPQKPSQMLPGLGATFETNSIKQ